MRRASLLGLACIVFVAVPAAGAAQTPPAPSLDSVAQLARGGDYEQARQAIDTWWRTTADPSPADAVRAHLLRGRLAVDPDSAETDYLAIVLGFPTQPQAAEALLRLGQLLVMKGEDQRAQGYLQRLAADYPGSEFRGPGLLWLARAYNAGGRRSEACNAARLGLEGSGANPDLSSLLHLEEATACRAGDDSVARRSARVSSQPARRPSPAAPAPRQAATPKPAAASPAPTSAASEGRFAVQVGAFRQRGGAESLAARLEKAGHSPRLVLVPNSGLLRVRLGHFPTAQDAADLVRRLKSQGFPAVVVGDADREHKP